jgi:predicted permease
MNDLRSAVRSLARRPGSTALGVLALALGIGANAAIFSFVEGIVLRPLPYPDSDRLVDLAETRGVRSTAAGAVSPRDLDDFKTLDTIFTGLAGFSSDGKNASFAGAPERLSGLLVEPGYLDVLGVQPGIGRNFVKGEDTVGNDGVVIISDTIHARRFDGTASILEKSLMLDGRPYRIVGVMPTGFRAPDELAANQSVDYLVPGVIPEDMRRNRSEHILKVLGRLQPAVTLDQANAALAGVMGRVAKEAEADRDVRAFVRSSQVVISGGLRTPMLLLLGASALIFFIASVNVASLLTTRAVEEAKEVAVRIALGASRGRVVRESMVRSLVLAATGCVLGLVVAFALKGLLVAVAPARTPRLADVQIDLGVIAAAALLSLVGAAVFGLLPALSVSRARATEALRSAGRGGVGREARRGRGALVAVEIALALLPLVGSALLLRSFAALRGVDLGFETENVLVANLPLPQERYATPEARFAFFEALAERARAIPSVAAVGFANRFPLRGGWESGIQFDGDGSGTYHSVPFQAIGGDYFKALGVPLIRGRAFDSRDVKEGEGVAIVNEAFVRKYLADKGDALGRRFRRGEDRPWISVVGVVGDLRRDGLAAALDPQAYLSAAQTGLYPVRLSDLAVRGTGDPSTLLKPLQAAVWSLDAEQPLTNVRTLAETIEGTLSPRRFQTILLALFALLALVLSLMGVYGIVGATVAQRTQEIGLRMALGARAAQVARMVVGESLVPATVGLVVGLAGSVAVARAMAGLVFGIEALDPLTFAAAPVSLLVATVLASLVPALRAARVEPTTALRDE